MVGKLVRSIREAVGWGWATLLRRRAPEKLFPEEPPPAAPLPSYPDIVWSLVSEVGGGALSPANLIEKLLADNRERFASGSLVGPLAELARRGIPVVAHILETGAIDAQHIVAVFPAIRTDSSSA